MRNATNKATASATADAKGAFSVAVPIVIGPNSLTLTATDPAGNVGSAPLAVIGGKGHLRVVLTPTASRISAARLPAAMVLTATALDPDGNPLPDIPVAFTLTLPGLPPFSADGLQTDASGRASFRQIIPAGTGVGTGSATAQISSGPWGDASTEIAITVDP